MRLSAIVVFLCFQLLSCALSASSPPGGLASNAPVHFMDDGRYSKFHDSFPRFNFKSSKVVSFDFRDISLDEKFRISTRTDGVMVLNGPGGSGRQPSTHYLVASDISTTSQTVTFDYFVEDENGFLTHSCQAYEPSCTLKVGEPNTDFLPSRETGNLFFIEKVRSHTNGFAADMAIRSKTPTTYTPDCRPLSVNGDSNDKLDVTFIALNPSRWESEDAFKAYLNGFLAYLRQMDWFDRGMPSKWFPGNEAKFNFWYVFPERDHLNINEVDKKKHLWCPGAEVFSAIEVWDKNVGGITDIATRSSNTAILNVRESFRADHSTIAHELFHAAFFLEDTYALKRYDINHVLLPLNSRSINTYPSDLACNNAGSSLATWQTLYYRNEPARTWYGAFLCADPAKQENPEIVPIGKYCVPIFEDRPDSTWRFCRTDIMGGTLVGINEDSRKQIINVLSAYP